MTLVSPECVTCVMDATDPGLDLDQRGVCRYCRSETARKEKAAVSPPEPLATVMEKIALEGKRSRRRYDCIVGLSGGVDSSYVALLAKDAGLRTLCIHFDNGWNTEIAVGNIRGIVESLGFDLETYVIDWSEFRDLQRAFLRAGVIDLEMLSDHAIFAAMYRVCRQYGIRHILSGTNYATESGLPRAWVWPKMDWRNIRAIHRRFGDVPLKTFPRLPTWRFLLIRYLKLGATWHEPLNHVAYRKAEAMERLKREVGWRSYGGKHHESRITRFYQNYILPAKFGVDKRKSHLSALIRNGELTREAALAELDKPLYDRDELRRDREFVLKKLGFSDAEFSAMMAAKPVPHDAYPSDQSFFEPLFRLRRRLIAKKTPG